MPIGVGLTHRSRQSRSEDRSRLFCQPLWTRAQLLTLRSDPASLSQAGHHPIAAISH